MDKYSDFVGTNVRKLRDRLGLSQDQLAELSGVSREQISRIENGKKKIISTSLHKIADAAGINVRQLMAGLDNSEKIKIGEGLEKYGDKVDGQVSHEDALKLLEEVYDVILRLARSKEAQK